MKRVVTSLMVLVMLVSVMTGPAVAGTTPSSSAVLVVDGESDGDAEYATIQAAVNDATEGDTVKIRAGTYNTTVEIGVPNLTLTGVAKDAVVIRAPDDTGAPAITVSPGVSAAAGGNPALRDKGWWRSEQPERHRASLLHGVTVSDLTVTRASGSTTEGSGKGIYANYVNDLEIRNVVVKNQDDKGIGIGWSLSPTVADVKSFSQQGVGSTPGDGISFFNTDDGRLEDIMVHDTGDDGVDIQGSNNTLVDIESYDNPVLGIEVEGIRSGTTVIRDVDLHDNGGADAPDVDQEGHNGLFIEFDDADATVTVLASDFRDNTEDAIAIAGPENVTVAIHFTNIAGSPDNALDVQGGVDVNAELNWWGDRTGPDSDDIETTGRSTVDSAPWLHHPFPT